MQQHTRINNTQTHPTAIKPGAGKRPLHPYTEEQVYSNAVALRQQGICVSLAGIARDMRQAVTSVFPNCTFKASSGWIKGFKKRHSDIRIRVPTCFIPAKKWIDGIGSMMPKDKIDSFFTFKDNLFNDHSYPLDNIVNMDETPVYFNNPSRKTVHFSTNNHIKDEPVMVKTMEGNPRGRITVMLTCTASGKLLDPCMVEASKCRAARENAGSTRYERQDKVACWKQENNTVNSSIMVDWIENWLAPRYSIARSKGERVLLIMDSAPGHKTSQVKEACKRNDIDICMIPGGCTKYLQPLDLTVNRSFKSKLKDGYALAMQDYTGLVEKPDSVTRLNMRKLTENVINSVKGITKQCVENGWRKMDEARNNQPLHQL